MTRWTWWVAMFVVSCGGAAPSPAPPSPRGAATIPATSSASNASNASNASSATAPSPPADRAAPLPRSAAWSAERVLDASVTFLVTGEDGRIGVLADEGGAVVPQRFERGRWERIALPSAHATTTAASSLGLYFGRDNRPRLMGFRADGGDRRMVYLRFRDGVWQDQRSEIGALASDGSQLHGVLGEVDPEVVCKAGGTCLLKSRKGWKEIPNTLPTEAVVRVFEGRGYALTGQGVFRAEDRGFTRVGPPAAWAGPATGFFVSAREEIAVVEPGASVIHRLDPGASAWVTERSPIDAPRDVGGSAEDRWVCGDGGLARREGDHYERVGEPSMRLARWIATSTGALVGGPSGVFAVRRGAP